MCSNNPRKYRDESRTETNGGDFLSTYILVDKMVAVNSLPPGTRKMPFIATRPQYSARVHARRFRNKGRAGIRSRRAPAPGANLWALRLAHNQWQVKPKGCFVGADVAIHPDGSPHPARILAVDWRIGTGRSITGIDRRTAGEQRHGFYLAIAVVLKRA